MFDQTTHGFIDRSSTVPSSVCWLAPRWRLLCDGKITRRWNETDQQQKKKWHTQTGERQWRGRTGQFRTEISICEILHNRYGTGVPTTSTDSQLKKRPTTLLCTVQVDAFDHYEIQLNIGFWFWFEFEFEFFTWTYAAATAAAPDRRWTWKDEYRRAVCINKKVNRNWKHYLVKHTTKK
jgi:hypothetical protein